MLIKQATSGPALRPNSKSTLVVVGLLVVAAIALGVKYFVPLGLGGTSSEVVTCDLEDIKIVDGKTFFYSDGRMFENGDLRSAKDARSGSYSCRLDGDQKYGLLYDFTEEAQPNTVYRASVWRRGNKLNYSYLVASGKGETSFYKDAKDPSVVERDDWEQLEIFFKVPYGATEVKVYVHKSSGGEVFFDDFKIEKVSNQGMMNRAGQADSFPTLDLQLGAKQLAKIKDKRQEAFKRGVLFSEDDDWVKGDLVADGEVLPVKARLKGDWMDHLSGKKWSFRISTRKATSWNRMITFSVQNPQVRHYLSEWVYHRLCEREDILTNRYDFIRFKLNGESRGIYVYEEHFEKQLVEYKERREGPIIRFSEDGVWNARKRELDFDNKKIRIETKFSTFESAEITPFKEGRTAKDSVLSQQFVLARTLLQQFRFGQKAVSEVFDVDKLAKFYAIADLCKARHGLVWHNMRFYYNPVISRLEPIAYDGFTMSGVFEPHRKLLRGSKVNRLTGIYDLDRDRTPFLDKEVMEKYIYYLQKYSSKAFIETFNLEIAEDLKLREAFIQEEEPNYVYEDQLVKNANDIFTILYPLNDNSIRAHRQEGRGDSVLLKIANFHMLPLEVVGFGKTTEKVDMPLDHSHHLLAYHHDFLPDYQDLVAPTAAKVIFCKMPGIDSLFYSNISNWPLALPSVPAQEMFAGVTPHSNPLYDVTGKRITFMPGQYVIDTAIVIPAGYEVQFEPGVEIDFVKKAFFLSRSPVKMLGNPQQLIRLFSSDHTARGFTVLQADGPSEMQHVRVEHFNTLIEKGWRLTGAVTFYESPLNMSHCVLIDNHCEDALNTIRTDFSVEKTLISNTFSDGFDADFCKGTVKECRFVETGNDCIDFSGSRITIIDCEIVSPGDKGISVGEESFVTVKSASIEGGVLGVASKDLSKLTIEQISMKNCQTAFAAYQKKPEYGGATIVVKNYEAEGIQTMHKIELGSKLWLKGVEISE